MSGPDAYINDSSIYRSNTFLQAFARKKNVQTGDGMKDYIELDKVATGGYIAANHKFDIQGSDGGTEYSSDWGIYGNYMTWEQEEREQNEEDRKALYKRLYKGKRMRMRTNTLDDFNANMWATPTLAMESPSSLANDVPRIPYSIPALITPSGTAPSGWSGTVSTVMQINPTTKTGWKNQYAQFTNYEADIEGKLFDMYYLSNWNEVADPEAGITGTPQDQLVIYADLASIKGLRNVLRNANDRMSNLGMYDTGVSYMNKAIVWAEPLGAQDTTTANQKLYGVNYEFLYPIIRDGYFLQITDDHGQPFRPHNQPRTNILYEFTEYNWWMRSRRRHWLITN